MTARIIPVEIFDLVVFGATGDLAQRKLIPALFQRDLQGQIPDHARIIGTSRGSMSAQEFREFCAKAIQEHVDPKDLEEQVCQRFYQRLFYIRIDVEHNEGWDALNDLLAEEAERIRVFYLAVGPNLFVPICHRIGTHNLVNSKARLVIEKPIGTDGASARKLNDIVAQVFPENRIYRIDHYLGKETVQNLMALRFANALFEPLWNSAHIDHVQIMVGETLGVESRAGYYDKAGALRDMVQNHILQLLCLVAMEPPVSIDAENMRDEKLKILRSLKPIIGDDTASVTVRGQYKAGVSDGKAVPSYLDELGALSSQTETFVALKAEIGNWRWNGVPFYLLTGKRLAKRVSEIIVTFRPIPHSVFERSAGIISPNRLIIRLQPDEGVKLTLMIKDPGPGGMRLQHVPLDMSFAAAFNVRNPDAYERLLMDVVRGNQTLFMRRDEVEQAWEWIDPILESWHASTEAPKPYAAGTLGPSAAVALIERDGRTWYEDPET